MASDTTPSMTDNRSTTGSNTLLNALIGAVAAIILSFVPLSTVLGGAIAAYLEGGTPRDGMKVGAVAGLMMVIPLMLFGIFFGSFFFTGNMLPPMTGGRHRTPIGIMAIFLMAVGILYTVGFSIVGGYLGNYLENEL